MLEIDDFSNYLHGLYELDDDGPERSAAILALDGGIAAVRDYCGWSMYPPAVEVEWTLNGDGTTILRLPTLALTAVGSVTIDGDLIDADEYSWSASGLLYRSLGWPSGFRNIVVSDISHGYTDRPAGPALVALALAAREFLNFQRLTVATVGTVTRRYALTTMETRLLDPHRIP